MKTFISLLLMLNTAVAFGAYHRPRTIAQDLDNSPFGERVQLGTQITDKAVHVLRGQWDFNVSGGANNTTIDLKDIDGKSAVLPPGAIVKGCSILMMERITSSGSAVVGLSTGLQRGDVVNDVAFSPTYAGIDTVIGCQINSGTASTWVKLPGNYTAAYTLGYTSAYTPTLTISGAALTAGKIRVLLEWVLSR